MPHHLPGDLATADRRVLDRTHGGRDGFLYRPRRDDAAESPGILQCKHTAVASSHLALSDMKTELDEAIGPGADPPSAAAPRRLPSRPVCGRRRRGLCGEPRSCKPVPISLSTPGAAMRSWMAYPGAEHLGTDLNRGLVWKALEEGRSDRCGTSRSTPFGPRRASAPRRGNALTRSPRRPSAEGDPTWCPLCATGCSAPRRWSEGGVPPHPLPA